MKDHFDPFSVAGKGVLITGGTAGIGLGVARRFAAADAQVVLTGRRAAGAEIAAAFGARFVAMDVSDPQSVTGGVRAAAGLMGAVIDVLILNAGIGLATGTIHDLDLDRVRANLDVNLFGVVHGLKEVLPYMRRGGSVIITSSPAGVVHMAGLSGYGASKAAVNALTRIWAIELGPDGIRVNAVLPGIVESELAHDPEGQEEEVEVVRVLTQSGKVRKPAELGPTFQFLASDASAPVTGALIACDDGLTAGYSSELMERAFP